MSDIRPNRPTTDGQKGRSQGAPEFGRRGLERAKNPSRRELLVNEKLMKTRFAFLDAVLKRRGGMATFVERERLASWPRTIDAVIKEVESVLQLLVNYREEEMPEAVVPQRTPLKVSIPKKTRPKADNEEEETSDPAPEEEEGEVTEVVEEEETTEETDET